VAAKAAAEEGRMEKSGWLHKRGNTTLAGWKKRFFVLQARLGHAPHLSRIPPTSLPHLSHISQI
jgi:hypothetical protein